MRRMNYLAVDLYSISSPMASIALVYYNIEATNLIIFQINNGLLTNLFVIKIF